MNNGLTPDEKFIFGPNSIRGQAQRMNDHLLKGNTHFNYSNENFEKVFNRLIFMVQQKHKDLDSIPFHSRWRHLEDNQITYLNEIQSDPLKKAKLKWDLVIVSVLLDAGAGNNWNYQRAQDKKIFNRSHGLSQAAYAMFLNGIFSTSKKDFLVEGTGLINLKEEDFIKGFQITQSNALVGILGRLELMKQLGKIILENKTIFPNQRPSDLIDTLINQYGKKMKAFDVLQNILIHFREIWPSREKWNGKSLGDTWYYPPFGEKGNIHSYIPFHKLSQWLTYSLFEPLVELGIEIVDLNQMTGLSEYRNGGLFVDGGVLKLKTPLAGELLPSDELIIEWRALTLFYLDKLYEKTLTHLNLTQEKFPLVKLLEAGTWWVGREMAFEKRKDGSSPIPLKSDGTLF